MEKEGRLGELIGDQSPSSAAFPKIKRGQERKEQRNVRREAVKKIGVSRSLRERRYEEMI